MLIVMRDGLPKNADMWKSTMIKSMTKFFEVYVDKNIDIKHLMQSLNNFYLKNELATAISVNPKDRISGMVYCIARAYNKGKRGATRLDVNKLLPDNT